MQFKNKDERKRFVCKIAAFIYATAVLEQGENNYCVSQEDMEAHFGEDFFPDGWVNDKELIDDIADEIMDYKGCEGNGESVYVEGDENGKIVFNVCLWTNFIACNYDAEEGWL